MSELCSWARYTAECSTEPPLSRPPRRHQRCWEPAGTGRERARGMGRGPTRVRPATAAAAPPPRRSPSASRHRDRAEGGTGSEEGEWEAQGHEEAGASGVAAQRFREGRATENRQTPHRPRPHAASRGGVLCPSRHPSTHPPDTPLGRVPQLPARLRQDGAASTAPPTLRGSCAARALPARERARAPWGRGAERRGPVTPPPFALPALRRPCGPCVSRCEGAL